MRWLLLVALVACSPAQAVQPTPTEDPRVAVLQAQNDDLKAQVQILAARIEEAKTTPTFVMWNTPRTIGPGQILPLGLPDTFTVRIQFTATTPVRVRIMNFDQYVRFMNTAVSDGAAYSAATSLDITFHEAEGCAAYIAVFDAAAPSTITPNVTITRVGPDHPLTGVCAR